MLTVFLLAFVICLVLNLSSSGEAYLYFSRIVTAVNSIRDKSPRHAKDKDRIIEIEYVFGKRRHAVIVLKRDPLNWTQVGALKNGEWIDKTAKISYYGGPFKNFHGLGLAPKHISPKYDILAFRFPDDIVIHVQKDEIILTKIKAAFAKSQ